jgi:Mg2+ and Co2+ transporter CorA
VKRRVELYHHPAGDEADVRQVAIEIEADDVAAIDAIEKSVRERFEPHTIYADRYVVHARSFDIPDESETSTEGDDHVSTEQ